LSIDAFLLAKQRKRAFELSAQLYEDRRELSDRLAAAGHAAQEPFDRLSRIVLGVPIELAELEREATTAAGVEALVNFELECREMAVTLLEEVKTHSAAVGLLVIEAVRQTGRPTPKPSQPGVSD
jgi:hypothetical protein